MNILSFIVILLIFALPFVFALLLPGWKSLGLAVVPIAALLIFMVIDTSNSDDTDVAAFGSLFIGVLFASLLTGAAANVFCLIMRKMKIGIFRKTRVGAIFAVLSVMLCAICASYFLFPVHPEITPPPIACTSKKHDVVLAGQRLSIPVAEIIRFQKTNELGQKYLSQMVILP
jgi:hypothetical protein